MMKCPLTLLPYLRRLLLIGGGIVILVAIGQDKFIGVGSSQIILTTYQPSDKNFSNPERGFAVSYDPPWPNKITWDFCNPSQENSKKYTYTAWTEPLNLASLLSQQAQGMSLAMVRYHIAEFRDRPLSSEFLNRLDTDFATARKANIKLVIRFTYNWAMGGPDASLKKVHQHLNQIKKVLQKNVDVIAFMDAGFIGCWGEWHTSSNNLIGDYKTDGAMNNASRLILDKIFEILPQERMVAVRVPRFKFQYFGSKNGKPIAPLTMYEAFIGSKKARWGQHDDCLVCGEWNFGTYWSPQKIAEDIRNFLSQDNRYVVQSGEPGDAPDKPSKVDEDSDGYTSNYESCTRVLEIFRQMRWSTINVNYNLGSPISYKRWKKEGCYDTIAKKLGYRFRLLNSSIPNHVKLGGVFSMSFKIANDGWASPYNPRGLEIIFRNRTNGRVFRLVLSDDPRFWQAGEISTVNIRHYLPVNIAPGEYDILLNLPDPHLNLKNRPKYSIRLANKDIWEASTGYNSFLRRISIQ
ncbi:DUF4832 domain-containing protein [Dolichospermum sp. ST_sed9]|nr:DUF4832 domain-containing protein [Dolichospermum sp. ST_sed9]